jgi:hypothetical protein
LPADIEDHRPVPSDQGGEGSLAGGILLRGETLEELPVGEPGDRAAVEKRPDLSEDGT